MTGQRHCNTANMPSSVGHAECRRCAASAQPHQGNYVLLSATRWSHADVALRVVLRAVAAGALVPYYLLS